MKLKSQSPIFLAFGLRGIDWIWDYYLDANPFNQQPGMVSPNRAFFSFPLFSLPLLPSLEGLGVGLPCPLMCGQAATRIMRENE